jgi:hypothetical protein
VLLPAPSMPSSVMKRPVMPYFGVFW